MDDTTIAAPLAKTVSVWAMVGITSWTDAASAIAFFYTMILICEWCWKKFLRNWLGRGER